MDVDPFPIEGMSRWAHGWRLDLSGEEVTQLKYDYAFTLLLGPRYEVRIEGVFTTTSGDRTQNFDPEAEPMSLAETLRFSRAALEYVVIHDSGPLEIAFLNGELVRVESDPDYEAWTMNGPGGLLIVARPRGELAIFLGQKSTE